MFGVFFCLEIRQAVDGCGTSAIFPWRQQLLWWLLDTFGAGKTAMDFFGKWKFCLCLVTCATNTTPKLHTHKTRRKRKRTKKKTFRGEWSPTVCSTTRDRNTLIELAFSLCVHDSLGRSGYCTARIHAYNVNTDTQEFGAPTSVTISVGFSWAIFVGLWP